MKSYTSAAKDMATALQMRIKLEDEFKRLLRKNKTEAQVALISLQRIIQGHRPNVG